MSETSSTTLTARRGARRLTEAAIQRTRPPASGRIDIADAVVTGLYLRITAKDRRSWSLLYRGPGQKRQQRLTLGRWPLLGVAEARKLARDALIQASTGHDPAQERRERCLQQSDLVEDVVAEFVERILKVQQRRWAATKAIMNDKLVRRWKGRPIGQVRKSDILKMLDQEMDAGHGRMANRTLQISRQFFSWAIERGYIDHDPTAGINRPAKERTRDRVLSSDEISAIWDASCRFGHPFGTIVKLLLLLGQRRAEVAEMRWSELDIEAKVWAIPSNRTKNERPHDVPLSPPVIDVLAAIPKLDDRVFPSVRKLSEKSVSGFSKAKRCLDQFIAKANSESSHMNDRSNVLICNVEPWVLHDLRRTAVTGMAELGVQPHVIEAVVNHVSGHRAGVVGVYNRASYAVEKRVALNRWADHVVNLIGEKPEANA